jgi:hypothetical protein
MPALNDIKKNLKNKSLRIVIDTGVWVSFLIGKALKGLQHYLNLKNQSITILFSDELFEEVIEVLHRPKIKKYLTDEQIADIIGLIYHKAQWIKIVEKTDICRDKKDNFLLDLAGNGKADYLITGDEDLLILKDFHGTKIVNFKDFNKLFS